MFFKNYMNTHIDNSTLENTGYLYKSLCRNMLFFNRILIPRALTKKKLRKFRHYIAEGNYLCSFCFLVFFLFLILSLGDSIVSAFFWERNQPQ